MHSLKHGACLTWATRVPHQVALLHISHLGDVPAEDLGAHPVKADQDEVAEAELAVRLKPLPGQPCPSPAIFSHRACRGNHNTWAN